MTATNKFVEVRKRKTSDYIQKTPDKVVSPEKAPHHQDLETPVKLETGEKLIQELKHQSRGNLEDKKAAYKQEKMEQTPYWYGDSYKTLTRHKTVIEIKTEEELTSLASLLHLNKQKENQRWSGLNTNQFKACKRLYQNLEQETQKRDLR